MNKRKDFREIFIIFTFTAVLSACMSVSGKNNPDITTRERSGESSYLTWEDRYLQRSIQYTGTIPAADCPGINVQITLNSNYTFSLVYNYIDRDFNITETGTFEWDETSSIIILKDSSYPPYYRIENDRLRQLDIYGNEITGNFADMYVLKQTE